MREFLAVGSGSTAGLGAVVVGADVEAGAGFEVDLEREDMGRGSASARMLPEAEGTRTVAGMRSLYTVSGVAE